MSFERVYLLVCAASLALGGCISTHVKRASFDLTLGSPTSKELTTYCNETDRTAGVATGGGCSMGSPTNGWAIVRCDPIGVSPSGNPNISPGSGQRAIGWRMSIEGPAGSTPSSAHVWAVCAD